MWYQVYQHVVHMGHMYTLSEMAIWYIHMYQMGLSYGTHAPSETAIWYTCRVRLSYGTHVPRSTAAWYMCTTYSHTHTHTLTLTHTQARQRHGTHDSLNWYQVRQPYSTHVPSRSVIIYGIHAQSETVM